jgi:oxygen-dependent protoporphyrinogen oxidase
VYEYEKEYGSVIMGLLRAKHSAKAKAEKKEEEDRWAVLGELGKERERWAMYGIRGGLGSLTARLEREIKGRGVDVKLGEIVESLQPNKEGVSVS